MESRIEIGPHVLHHGDCLQVLKSLPDCSVDSVVTDPPAGINFMGKEWDQAKLGRDRWIDWLEERMRECFRVLKPGGHALVWALPRTSHWTATACEDAGFEIRDMIYHIFGTGFPKSMDISKAIDKSAGKTREVIGVDPARAGRLVNQIGEYETDAGWSAGNRSADITAPATPEAAQWEGWGTALKPSVENWILCRKPVEGTVAANVLKYGTGGLNIDGCRIGVGDPVSGGGNNFDAWRSGQDRDDRPSLHKVPTEGHTKGRFPAHLIHDGSDEVLAGFPNSKDGVAVQRNGGGQKIGGDGIYQGSKGLTRPDTGYGGEGSAARFFYCSKASKKDRNEGLPEGVKSSHPTVKNTDLMQYLCRLITPPGGIVLDPFAGSFSTGKAAIKEGFRFIGIEAEREYFDVGVQRIRHEAEKNSGRRHGN